MRAAWSQLFGFHPANHHHGTRHCLQSIPLITDYKTKSTPAGEVCLSRWKTTVDPNQKSSSLELSTTTITRRCLCRPLKSNLFSLPLPTVFGDCHQPSLSGTPSSEHRSRRCTTQVAWSVRPIYAYLCSCPQPWRVVPWTNHEAKLCHDWPELAHRTSLAACHTQYLHLGYTTITIQSTVHPPTAWHTWKEI